MPDVLGELRRQSIGKLQGHGSGLTAFYRIEEVGHKREQEGQPCDAVVTQNLPSGLAGLPVNCALNLCRVGAKLQASTCHVIRDRAKSASSRLQLRGAFQ
jgi:hypothetical protein